MAQISSTQDVNCKPHHFKALIGAAIDCTTFRGKVTLDHIYKTVAPMKKMGMEECWALWTTYTNINLWYDRTKKCLIHHGYVIDKLQRVIDIFNGHK